MGQINTASNRSIYIDLTPMVDLGFLLITFFVFTTSMSEPKSMKLYLPKETKTDSTRISEKNTISFLLGESGKLYSYAGNSLNDLRSTNYNEGLRSIIADKRSLLKEDAGNLVVLIKPLPGCNYENVVNILDEMIINQVKKYYLMDPAQVEEIAITKILL